MPSVCYLVQTYHLPQQVYRLLATLRAASPDAILLVSHDQDRPPLDAARLAESRAVLLTGPGGRGDFATVQRYLDAARFLADGGQRCDWLVNITGQDYPVVSPRASEQALTTGGFDGYIEHFRVFSAESPWGVHEGRSRYLFSYRWLRASLGPRARRLLRPLLVLNFVQPILRINVSYGLTVGRRVRSPFTRWPCYGGSFYCALSWPCVEYVLRFCADRPDLVAYFRHTLVPEEAFLQTVLVNAGRFRLRNDAQRFYDFSASADGSPAVLRRPDLDRALSSGAHFARKFDVRVDPEVLDDLDAVIR